MEVSRLENHRIAREILKKEIVKTMKKIKSKKTTDYDRPLLEWRLKCLKKALNELSGGLGGE
jgi:hypothetical protein